MPIHHEIRRSPHSVQELYSLILDIEKYPEFLPWCVAARIVSRDSAELQADLVIRFKAFSEKFTSRVTPKPAETAKDSAEVQVELVHGPFTHLSNHWKLVPLAKGGTDIHFSIDFRFKSPLFEKLIGALFEKAVKKMVGAFETRADKLFGKT